jgi:transposase-like protein
VWEWRKARGVDDGGYTAICKQLGLQRETLRRWVIEAEQEQRTRPGPSKADRSRIAELEREKRELRRANEMAASTVDATSSVYFAGRTSRYEELIRMDSSLALKCLCGPGRGPDNALAATRCIRGTPPGGVPATPGFAKPEESSDHPTRNTHRRRSRTPLRVMRRGGQALRPPQRTVDTGGDTAYPFPGIVLPRFGTPDPERAARRSSAPRLP